MIKNKMGFKGMVICGLDLEGLIKVFQNFSPNEVEETYNRVHKINPIDTESIQIIRNCL